MPAKTVKDLIEFNNSVPDKLKVAVCIESFGSGYMNAYFVFKNTMARVEQVSKQRIEYYGKNIDQEEEASKPGLTRLVDPTNKPMFPWGHASCKSNNTMYACNNAWFISISDAAKGYGPMLYDCLIAKLGEYGFGLTADRSLVSPLAANVWVGYLADRPDVKKKLLDFDNSTPEPDDDCYEEHQRDPSWNTWVKDPERNLSQTDEEHEKELEKRKKMRKAVKYAYFDDGITTLKELKQAGLLIDHTTPLKENFALQNLYENTDFLHKLYNSILKG